MKPTKELKLFASEIIRANKHADILADFIDDLTPKLKKKKAISTVLAIEEFESIIVAFNALSNHIEAMQDVQDAAIKRTK